MTPTITEILSQIHSTDSKNQKKQILLSNNTPYLQTFLKLAFDPSIQFHLSDFPKQYQPSTDTAPGISYSDIPSELKRVYLFQVGNPTADSLSPEKRSLLLLQLLESFHPDEAKTFINMLNKNLKVKGLTDNLIKEVFPNLL